MPQLPNLPGFGQNADESSNEKAEKQYTIVQTAMTDDDMDTIDLLELFFALWDRKFRILIVAIICAVIAGACNMFLINPTYEATSEIYIANTDSVIDVNDLQVSSDLTVDYTEIMLSRTVLKKVIADQNLHIKFSTLKDMISVTNPEDSHCLIVAVQCTDPKAAVRIANSFVKIGIDQIYRVVGNDVPSVIDQAELDSVTIVSASTLKMAIYGALAGLIVICGYIIIGVLMDMSLKTEEDAEQYIGLSVLASVPNFNQEGGKYGYGYGYGGYNKRRGSKNSRSKKKDKKGGR